LSQAYSIYFVFTEVLESKKTFQIYKSETIVLFWSSN